MANRTVEDRIRELEAKIANIKERAQRKQVKANPAVKHMSQALKSIDKALDSTDDAVLRKSLDEARVTVSSCLGLLGITPKAAKGPKGTRKRAAAGGEAPDAAAVLDFVLSNPGSNSEQITSALNTDAASLRPVMQSLIDDDKVATKGEKRGRRYYPSKERAAKAR